MVRFVPPDPDRARAILLVGSREGLDDITVRKRLDAVVSASRTVTGMAAEGMSSLSVWVPMVEIVGRVLPDDREVKVNAVTVLVCPSFTVTVISQLPVTLVPGRSVTEPLLPPL